MANTIQFADGTIQRLAGDITLRFLPRGDSHDNDWLASLNLTEDASSIDVFVDAED